MNRSIIKYIRIFIIALITSATVMVALINIDFYAKHNEYRERLAFIDSISHEVIPFPEFDEKMVCLSEQVCIRNSSGQIVFWGEYDYSTATMSGNILSVEAVLDQSNDKVYYLATSPYIIQTDNYYILYNSNTVQTGNGQEDRDYLTVHYCSSPDAY